MSVSSLVALAVSLVLAPLLPGIVARTKAVLAGRKGQPLAQGYHDLRKLLRKGAVYSRVTTWVFRAGPITALAALLVALLLVPALGAPAALAFSGDMIVFVSLLALARFATVLAALDTGSSFEGMGASREATFSVLGEVAIFVGLAALARATGSLTLSGMLGAQASPAAYGAGPALALVCVSFFVVLLAENARIPVDDPDTHLELTMIHEVMVLDHGGPDLALIQYGASLKLYLFASVLAGIAVPVRTGLLLVDAAAALGGVVAVAVLVGIIESTTARLQLARVPQLLLGASVLAGFSLVLTLR